MIKPKTARALQLIRDREITRPIQLAELLWPESDGWKRGQKRGHTSVKGMGMAKAAGSFLGKLARRELIDGGPMRGLKFYLTADGIRELELFELQQNHEAGQDNKGSQAA
jgi:hypothetical protein